MELLDRLGYASSKAEEGPREAADAARLGPDPERRAGRPPAAAGVNVLVTGGSRGIGRAIALRFAREGAQPRRDRLHAQRHGRRGDRRRSFAPPAPSRCSCAATSPRRACSTRWRRSARSTCSSTTPPPASSARRSTPRRSTGTGRSARTPARCSRSRRPPRPQMPAGSLDRRHLVARLAAGAPGLHADRRLEGGARGARPLPRGRARAARDPRERRLGRRRRDRRARALPEPRGDARRRPRQPGRAAWSTPEDVAAAVAFLCSPDAEMVRGHVLVVDGGFSLPV